MNALPSSPARKSFLLFAGSFLFLVVGCVSTGGTAQEGHVEAIRELTGDEYHIPKRPIDQHFIGAAWSKEFGPVEDEKAQPIRIRKERSLNSVQQDFAYQTVLELGAETLLATPEAEVETGGKSVERKSIQGVEIITPVSLADIPFKPGTPYVTEALRVEGFTIKSNKGNKAGVDLSAGNEIGNATAVAEVGSESRTGTSGEGLVVAYKLQEINEKSIELQKGSSLPLSLDATTEIPDAGIAVRAELHVIELGSGKSLPGNILWACDRAAAERKDIVAAWVVELKFTDRRHETLRIAFPGYPQIEDCDLFQDIVNAGIDIATDKIYRERVRISLVKAELSDSLRPVAFSATVSHEKESFRLKPVPASKL